MSVYQTPLGSSVNGIIKYGESLKGSGMLEDELKDL